MRVTWPYALPLCLSEKRPCGVAFPLPICLFEHGLCGAVNRDGSIAVAPRFDFVDEFHEGRALVRLRGLYGFVNSNGKVVIEPQYTLAGRYRLGYAKVDIDGKSALIDREGRPVLEPRFARAGAFTKGVFWVNDGVRIYRGPVAGAIFAAVGLTSGATQIVFVARGRWGLVDAAGTWIRRPEFTEIAIFDPRQRLDVGKDRGRLGLDQAGWHLVPRAEISIDHRGVSRKWQAHRRPCSGDARSPSWIHRSHGHDRRRANSTTPTILSGECRRRLRSDHCKA